MIIYHPGYDVYHCSYRILNILNSVDQNELCKEILKFIDFYYVYPHLLKRISKLPRPLNYHREKIEELEEPFEITPNSKSLYFELGIIQDSAINSLNYKSLVQDKDNKLILNKANLPGTLVKKFESDDFIKTDIYKILTQSFPKVNLNGENGFKARSGLMEYRYG